MTLLDEALALGAIAPGEWTAFAHPEYEGHTCMFGGWTAAVLLRAVVADERAEGTPVALTVHLLRPVPTGERVTLSTRALGGGQSLTTWHSELRLASGNELAAVATVVMAKRRDTETFTEPAMPSAPAPETLSSEVFPLPFAQKLDTRAVAGFPPFGRSESKQVAWRKERSGRLMDHAQLAFMCDAQAPAIFFRSSGPRPNSTISMSVYFYATPSELAAVGDDFVLGESTGTRAQASVVGSQIRLWSRGGALLATSEQVCWFR